MRALLLLLLPAVAHADVSAHVGAGSRGAIAGGELAVHHHALELAARVDVALDRSVRDRGELVARYRVAVVGARIEPDRAFALAGIRFGDRTRWLELGVVGRVAGGEMFVQHAVFAPGWLARGSWRHSRLILGGELGASGLAERTTTGALRGDTRAVVTLGVELFR